MNKPSIPKLKLGNQNETQEDPNHSKSENLNSSPKLKLTPRSLTNKVRKKKKS